MTEKGQATLLDRAARLVSDVRAGEATSALLMLLNVLLLLVGYYVLKTIREPLILVSGGAEPKSYASAGQALVLMGFVPLYGWFASRVDRVRLSVGVTLFFVANLELFFLGLLFDLPWIGVVFYIWLGIFVLVVLAQFWGFANDIYSKEAGDRLFPLIGIGGLAGSPLGAKVASWLFEAGVTVELMLQIPVMVLLVCLGLTLWVDRRETRLGASRPGRLARTGGFALVLRNRYLMLIAGVIILLNVVNTTGEYILSRTVLARAAELGITGDAARRAFVGEFYAEFYFWVNIAGLAVQALLVSRIVKYLGLTGAMLALPLVSLGAYSAVAAGAGFAVIRLVKSAENATDYSVMNTAKALLWLPTSRDEKYKAKQAVDSFFYRFGDMISAGLVFAGVNWLGFGVRSFALVNVAIVGLWFAVTVGVLRWHRRLVEPQGGTLPLEGSPAGEEG